MSTRPMPHPMRRPVAATQAVAAPGVMEPERPIQAAAPTVPPSLGAGGMMPPPPVMAMERYAVGYTASLYHRALLRPGTAHNDVNELYGVRDDGG